MNALKPTMWGYARVSTSDQDPALQLDALRRSGVDEQHILIEYASGARQSRPQLERLLSQAKAGDVITVWKLDRLGRSLSHLVAVVEELRRRSVQFRSLTEAIDTTSASGRLLFHLIAAVAEFERELVRERTAAALAAARAEGRSLGRPTTVTPQQYRQIKRLSSEGHSQHNIAKSTGLNRGAVGRALRGEIARIENYNQPEGSP